MVISTWIRLTSLLLALSSLTLQTPTTHVVTKTITAGDLGAPILPSGVPHAISPIIEINVPPLPMTPSGTITITAILTIDDPSSDTLFNVRGTHVIITLLLPLLCCLVVAAYRKGYMARLFKEYVKAAAAPKANRPYDNPAGRSSQNQAKQTEHPRQPSFGSKPPERPRPTSQPQPQPRPKPSIEEELEQKVKELKEAEDALRLERDAKFWESLFPPDDHEKRSNESARIPEPSTRNQPKPQTPSPAPKKKVTFADQRDYDVRLSSNQGGNTTTSLKGPRATFNIYT